MNYLLCEKLETFADLATSSSYQENESEIPYFDPSDPDNIAAALDYFHSDLTFLDDEDREELFKVWRQACRDCRDTKLLFNAVKVLQEKYA